jgi:hypothetical protein
MSKVSDFLHTSEDNPFETIPKVFGAFFKLDKEKIQAVIDLLNKKGANVSYLDIGKATGLDVGKEILGFRTATAFLVHSYIHHKKAYDGYIATTAVSKEITEGFNHFVERLDKKGLEGLDLLHLATQQNLTRPTLAGVTTRNYLAEVQDEDDKVIGYLPIMNIRLSILDEQNDIKIQNVNLSYDDIESLIHAFKAVQQEAKISAKHFQQKIGDSVMFSGDE